MSIVEGICRKRLARAQNEARFLCVLYRRTNKKNYKNKTVDFVAIKPIKKDEEITANYNYGNPNDKSQLWIKSIKPPVK